MTGNPPKSYEAFEHGPFRLEYLRFGKGPFPILAFHGFGRKCEDFAGFAPYLRQGYSLYSFNLFGHGRSRYPMDRMERDTVQKEEWAELFSRFLASIGADRAYLMGYSMGGRLALCLIEQMPERFPGAYLFAPDGLQRFSWFRWASRIPLLQRSFKRRIETPTLLFRTFRTFHRMGLFSRRTRDFLFHQTRTRAQRKAVYEIWNIHRDLSPDHQNLKVGIQEEDVLLNLIFGRSDPIIPASKGRKFLKRMDRGERIRMQILPKGHILLEPTLIMELKESGDFDDVLDLFF